MKIVFKKGDSIYKIFTTIEKIPNGRKLDIYIDHENPFYQNIWWGKQLKDLIESKNLKVTFLYDKLHLKDFFNSLGVEARLKDKNLFLKIIGHINNFFLKSHSYHTQIIKKGNYISYIFVVGEILFVGYLFYLFYSLISPSAKIYIKPSYNIEQIVYNFRFYPIEKADKYKDIKYISIPYYRGKIDINYTLSTDVQNIKYMQKPSKGTINLYNFTNRGYSIKAGTRFVTDEGLVFKTTSWLNIPPKKTDGPSKISVQLEASDVDLKGNIIGQRGNINAGKRVYIKNIYDSFYQKNIYGEAVDDFKGGTTSSSGTVQQKDIDYLQQRLFKYVMDNKNILLKEQLQSQDDKYPLFFDGLINIENVSYNINANVGQQLSNISGTINCQISFYYVKWDDIKTGYDTYIKQRISNNMQVVDMDKTSLVFYENYRTDDIFIIPTKLDVIWGYNFTNDVNGLKEEIKSKIAGKTKAEAQKLILEYPQIDFCMINLSPPWYDTIPVVKSRIKIDISK